MRSLRFVRMTIPAHMYCREVRSSTHCVFRMTLVFKVRTSRSYLRGSLQVRWFTKHLHHRWRSLTGTSHDAVRQYPGNVSKRLLCSSPPPSTSMTPHASSSRPLCSNLKHTGFVVYLALNCTLFFRPGFRRFHTR